MYTDEDKILLKYLAGHFIDKGNKMMISDLESLDCYSKTSINKLRTLNLIKPNDDISIQINPNIITEKNRLEVLPNHFKDLKSWWFSKKWSLPFTIIALVLPAIKTYIDLVVWLFK